MRTWIAGPSLLVLGTSIASAQPPAVERAFVVLQAITTPSGGRASTTGSVDLGDTVRFHVDAGSSRGSESLCPLEIGSLPDGRYLRTLLNEAHRVWTVEVTFLGLTDESFDVAVSWRRYRAGRRERMGLEEQNRRRVRLRAGEPYYVDFFAAPTTLDRDRCAAQNLLIELRIGFRADRRDLEFRHDLLRYQGWLVHEDADGGFTTSQFTALGKHGEAVRFRFEPQRQPAGTGAASALEIVTEVSGSVQGKKQPDGSIDLILRADQVSRIEKKDEPSLPSGAGGEKELNVQPGEVIRVELPNPTGRSSHRLVPPQPRQPSLTLPDVRTLGGAKAVTVLDGRLVVDLEKLFRGHRTSLTLSVTPVE